MTAKSARKNVAKFMTRLGLLIPLVVIFASCQTHIVTPVNPGQTATEYMANAVETVSVLPSTCSPTYINFFFLVSGTNQGIYFCSSANVWTELGTASGGSAAAVFQDGQYLKIENASDNTKIAEFSLADITSGQTRVITVPDADSVIPIPFSGVTHEFLTSLGTNGQFLAAQPLFSDISGVAAQSQIPNPTGDVTGTYAATTVTGFHFGSTYTPLSGTAPTGGQVLEWNGSSWTPVTPSGGGGGASIEVNGGTALASPVSLNNATGIVVSNPSGSNVAFTLQPASASVIGGVESIAAVSHEWINSISNAGVPALSQPAFTDISGTAAASQIPAPAGDVTGTYAATTVTGIHFGGTSTPISSTAPSSGDYLEWNGTDWVGNTPPGTANQSVSFVSATSAQLTMPAATQNIVWSCWDNASPANAIQPQDVTVSTAGIVTFTFQTPQTGYCVANGAGATGTTVTTTGSPAAGEIAAFSSPSVIAPATGHNVADVLVCSDTSGSGTTQTCTTSPSFTPAAGDTILYTTTTANTGTGLTVNVDALGAKSVAIPGASGWTTTLTAGIIPASKYLVLTYDGTNWDVQQTGTAATGGSSLWSGLGNPTGNLSLSMAGYTSTFDYSSALANAFEWANTTAATSTVGQPSPSLYLCGNGWEGSTPASTQDCFTLQNVVGNGSNAAPTLTIGYSGSSTGIPTINISAGTAAESKVQSSGVLLLSSGPYDSADIQVGGDSIIVAGNSSAFASTVGEGDQLASTSLSVTRYIQTPGNADYSACSCLTATAALTAGQVVKIDTANASSVVVAATTDAAGTDLGFVVNSPGVGAMAAIAAPGGIITTPVLGSGSCTVGQFVEPDTTTTGGDVTCSSTYTAGAVLGYATKAQSTIGGTVSVYVEPR